jgi:anthranilate/para-aminobenzoate synthase component I
VALTRTFDATFLNRVVNHPEVRPWLGGDGAIDLTAIIENPENVVLVNEHGGWIITKIDVGLYEAHSQFLPEGRNAALIDDMREGLRYLFTATDCVELLTKVPDNNKAADGLAQRAGFCELFRRESVWRDGENKCGVSYRSMTLDAWRASDDVVLSSGQWFHSRLEAEKATRGSTLETHTDDDAHDRAVGVAVAMIRAGNHYKAVMCYNRWAAFAGYAQIAMLSKHPPIFDIGDAVLALRGDDMEVLFCRQQ